MQYQQQPIPPNYESEYSFVPIETQHDPNIYSNAYVETIPIQQQHETYGGHQLHFDTQLHLALDDDREQSMVTENIYQQIHTPISPATTPTLIPHTSHLESIPENHIIHYTQSEQQPSTLTIEYSEEQAPLPLPQPPEDDFTYDDFDESCQSFPSDRNNVDNAIDKKIEEFIQNKRNKGNPKICTVCNKLFRTNYKLREHMQTHAENSVKYLCDFKDCNKTFRSKIGLKEHVARHKGEFNFSCTICDKKFLLHSYFLAHQKIHSNVKNFACNMCSKTFKSKQNLINHENYHYGLKLFNCETCQKQFTTKSNLDFHMKTTHTEVGQYECEDCHKFFKTKNYLKVHRKSHYKELQNYECSECKKTFIQLCDLKIHVKTHTNQRDFVCEVCGDAFTRKDSLKLHALTHTKEKRFACESCKKAFTRKSSLNNHKKKCQEK